LVTDFTVTQNAEDTIVSKTPLKRKYVTGKNESFTEAYNDENYFSFAAAKFNDSIIPVPKWRPPHIVACKRLSRKKKKKKKKTVLPQMCGGHKDEFRSSPQLLLEDNFSSDTKQLC